MNLEITLHLEVNKENSRFCHKGIAVIFFVALWIVYKKIAHTIIVGFLFYLSKKYIFCKYKEEQICQKYIVQFVVVHIIQ